MKFRDLNTPVNEIWLSQMPKEPPPNPDRFKGMTSDQLQDRMVGLNAAVEKLKQLKKIADKVEKMGLMNPGLQADTDVSVYINAGEKDNYKSLIEKTDQAIIRLTQRLNTFRAAYRKKPVIREQVLLEYNREVTMQNFGKNILAAAAKDKWLVNELMSRMRFLVGGDQLALKFADLIKTEPQETLAKIMQYIEAGDPTPHKEYAATIAKLYSKGQSPMEDIVSTLADYLTKFDKLKRRKMILPPRNDFNRYTTIGDFLSVVDEYPDPDQNADAATEKQNVKELYRDNSLIVLIPLDEKASCYYGKGTRWCTAASNANRFKYYSKDGPLYIIIPRQPLDSNDRYQFHFESKQYMDARDQSIGMPGIEKLVQRFPILTKILQQPAEKFKIPPLIGPEYRKIIADFNPTAKVEITQLIQKYESRILDFGIKQLDEYGINLHRDEIRIRELFPEYLNEVVQLLNSNKIKFWKELQRVPSWESDETVIETKFLGDPLLNDAAIKSRVYIELVTYLKKSNVFNGPDGSHPDAIPHIADLLLRDPLARFIMRNLANLYTTELRRNGHAI
ncbi:hypothetical protein UFOVP1636_43 [uncultured Caudovirales phage]|uniref:Uncharacterized protein n=1 Tax=uncultured Caudovirales phage TaxID=2100421 RepID=A0A6J5SZD5_9CAUD|nr:hypothetical protein UFOVP1636_43 [uncultured Caudovirales phage]